MLTSLSIKDLALIDSLSITFSHGFNVITGETGAGKSILIRALNILMGAKISIDAIRKGAYQAIITGEFLVEDSHPVLDELRNLGIPLETVDPSIKVEKEGSDNVGNNTNFRIPIILRRQVTIKGKSQSWINDIPVTIHPLRQLASYLIDLFGQHENQRLMDEAFHTAYIDNFLPNRTLTHKIATQCNDCLALVKEAEGILNKFETGKKSQDYIQFRLEAIDKFSPSSDDFENLKTYCSKAEHYSNVRESLVSAINCISGNENQPLPQILKEVSRLLARASSSKGDELLNRKLLDLKSRADSLSLELEDLHFEIEKHCTSIELDESHLLKSQDRIYGYQNLFRTHGVNNIDDLMQEWNRLRNEITSLEQASSQVGEVICKLEIKVKELLNHSQALSDARRRAATGVKKQIEKELHELAMPGANFDVSFSPVKRNISDLDFSLFGEGVQNSWKASKSELSKVSEKGAEKAQFLLTTNPGEPMLPLSKIASGGELSRIMLSFKRALAADADTCVLVFDEIDTGISGRIADVVGKKLQELSTRFQVICISHLAQVAVYADSHFLVTKGGRDGRTETSMIRLTSKESSNEIARILSGSEVSTPSLANAKSLIEKAGKYKAHLTVEK